MNQGRKSERVSRSDENKGGGVEGGGQAEGEGKLVCSSCNRV